MSIDYEQQQKMMEAKVKSLESQLAALQQQQKQAKDKARETQINSLQKDLKQAKTLLSAANKAANRAQTT
jgi:hypothetical protein